MKNRLRKSATKSFPYSNIATGPATKKIHANQYDLFTVDASYLDVMAAPNNNDTTLKTAMSPAARRDAAGKYRLVAGVAALWDE